MNIINRFFQPSPFGWRLPGTVADVDPVVAQAEQLRKLLARARKTVWGRKYGYSELCHASNCVRAFQDRVPLNDFTSFRPYVDRLISGERDLLWPGHIRNFAVSGGTTSSGKLIPLSPEMLRVTRRAAVDVAANYLRTTGNIDTTLGYLLSLPGTVDAHPEDSDIRVGDVSGFIAEHAPSLLARWWQAAPVHTFAADDWGQKLDLVVEHTLEMDVRAISMVPTWGPLLFQKLLAAHHRHRGRPAQSILDVWPNLRVIFSGGVALSSYRDLLEDQIGEAGRVDFMELYGASEGFFAMQTHPDDEDLLLRVDTGVFYEFIPVDDLGSGTPRRYTVADVSPHVPYAVYLSTCSGLWACAVRDVVRFTSTFPHRLVVAGRTGEMIDGHGEALFAEEARAALNEALEKTQAFMVDFHVAPRQFEQGQLPSHEWLIEFSRPPGNFRSFEQAVDDALRRMNRHYRIRRNGGAFGAPRITAVPRGTFYTWLHETRDRVSAQSKVPRME